jgi:hypothetical protein
MFTKIWVAVIWVEIRIVINLRTVAANNFISAMLEDFQHENVEMREAI